MTDVEIEKKIEKVKMRQRKIYLKFLMTLEHTVANTMRTY